MANFQWPIAQTQPVTIIGLMSGTSMDAVDACAVELSKTDDSLTYKIVGTHTQPMPPHVRDRLCRVMTGDPVSLKELCALQTVVGILFSDTVYGLLNSAGIKREAITVIGSHGQTIFHDPPVREGTVGQTLQIGHGQVIAEHIGIPVIYDFRSRDMALGGQGAPLVCYADELLFRSKTIGRAVQNIGGIANATILPVEGDVIAFDSGPGNMLIDGAMLALYGQPYDDQGKIAASGSIDATLLEYLMDNPYFGMQPPKSTGRELFGQVFLDAVLAKFGKLPKENIIATLTFFTAKTIVDAYAQFVFPTTKIHEIILGGGGTKNNTLREMILSELKAAGQPDILLTTHETYAIPNQYKEALAFAILAWASMCELPGNIPTCTGALRPVILGSLAF